MLRPRPRSILFPYTTLFRSRLDRIAQRRGGARYHGHARRLHPAPRLDRKSTRLNSSHLGISYAVFCLKKKNLPGVARLSERLVEKEDGLFFVDHSSSSC